MVATLVVVSFPGCTSNRLLRGTLEQAGTLTELQYQQVLNNLAMFCANPGAMPWHVNIRDGSAQIADLGSAQYVGDWHRAFSSHPALLGSRTVIEQWSMSPITDDTELKVLRLAYRRALGFGETLKDDDLANDLAHELKKQSSDLNEFLDETDRGYAEEKAMRRNELYNNIIISKVNLNKDLISNISNMVFSDEFAELVFPVGDTPDRVDKNRKRKRSFFEKYVDETVVVTDDQIIKPWEFIEFMYIYDVGKYFIGNEPPSEPPNKERLSEYPYPNVKYDGQTGAAFDAYGYPLKRVTPFAAEIRRQVKEVQKDLLEIGPGWYGVGGKKDVPRDACYIGRYRDCYVWVCRPHVDDLTRFTLKILNFASLIKETGVFTVPGPRFTPASGFPSL
jgi:hypothetical protein